MKVRKAYLFDHNPFGRCIRRTLIDEHGYVFIREYGWTRASTLGYKVVAFPKVYESRDWDWNGWYTTNWKDETWGWIYMAPERPFMATRRIVDEDGVMYQAA